MRRITFAIVSTLAVLVLLFSYRTSRDESINAKTVAIGQAHIVANSSVASSAQVLSTAAAASSVPGQITAPSAAVPAPSSSSENKASSKTSTAATTSKAAPTTTKAAATTTKSSNVAPVTVDGAAVSTRYGDVQVEVVITGGKITDVNAIEYPNQEPRDQEINQDALPQLRSQVLAAQSANIAGVGGATYTTEGYVGSLQSALDAANFK